MTGLWGSVSIAIQATQVYSHCEGSCHAVQKWYEAETILSSHGSNWRWLSSGRCLQCLKRVSLIPHRQLVKRAGNFKLKVLGVLVCTSLPCGGGLECIQHSPSSWRKQQNAPHAWEYTSILLFQPVTWGINTESWPFMLGWWPCSVKNYCCKIRRSENWMV